MACGFSRGRLGPQGLCPCCPSGSRPSMTPCTWALEGRGTGISLVCHLCGHLLGLHQQRDVFSHGSAGPRLEPGAGGGGGGILQVPPSWHAVVAGRSWVLLSRGRHHSCRHLRPPRVASLPSPSSSSLPLLSLMQGYSPLDCGAAQVQISSRNYTCMSLCSVTCLHGCPGLGLGQPSHLGCHSLTHDHRLTL